MSCVRYLKELLRPLGIYDLEAPFNGGELEAAGLALDRAAETLEEAGRESCLATAESWGLEQMARLFVRRPVAENPRAMGEALAALLRIGGDSFTQEAINDTLTGCGLPARVTEEGAGVVTVFFPGVPGIPAGFGDMRPIIEDILPVHLEVHYQFWRLTWSELEANFPTWRELEGRTWAELETSVSLMRL